MKKQSQYQSLGRSPFLLKTHIATRNVSLIKKGRAITTRFFCLQTASKQKRAQTRRSIPNVSGMSA